MVQKVLRPVKTKKYESWWIEWIKKLLCGKGLTEGGSMLKSVIFKKKSNTLLYFSEKLFTTCILPHLLLIYTIVVETYGALCTLLCMWSVST